MGCKYSTLTKNRVHLAPQDSADDRNRRNVEEDLVLQDLEEEISGTDEIQSSDDEQNLDAEMKQSVEDRSNNTGNQDVQVQKDSNVDMDNQIGDVSNNFIEWEKCSLKTATLRDGNR